MSIEPEKVGDPYLLRYIKVGFDDEFQPAIMIANSRSQVFDYRFPKDSDTAEKLGPECNAHQKLFDNSWVRTGLWKDNQHLPSSDGWLKGYYVLVHHRDRWPNRGYDCEALDLRIYFLLVPDTRPEVSNGSPKMIWAIDIMKIGRVKPERKWRLAQCDVC